MALTFGVCRRHPWMQQPWAYQRQRRGSPTISIWRGICKQPTCEYIFSKLLSQMVNFQTCFDVELQKPYYPISPVRTSFLLSPSEWSRNLLIDIFSLGRKSDHRRILETYGLMRGNPSRVGWQDPKTIMQVHEIRLSKNCCGVFESIWHLWRANTQGTHYFVLWHDHVYPSMIEVVWLLTRYSSIYKWEEPGDRLLRDGQIIGKRNMDKYTNWTSSKSCRSPVIDLYLLQCPQRILLTRMATRDRDKWRRPQQLYGRSQGARKP